MADSEKKTHAALKLSEEQFRRAIEEAPIPTIMQAEDGQVLQLSRSWTELTGYQLSDMAIFDNWLTNAVYDGAENVRNHLHELFKGTKKSINVEFSIRTQSKGIRNWSFSASSSGTLLDGRRFVIGMAVDITERKKAEDAFTYNNKKLELISDITSKLLSGQPPEQLVNEICYKIMRFLDFDVFFNFLIDEEKQMLHLNAYGGIPAEAAKSIEWLPIGESICGCAAMENRRIISEDIQNNGDLRATLVRSYGVQAYCATPLISKGTVIGTLSFGSKKRASFTPDELALMQTVVDHVSIAMARKKAEDTLRQSESKYRLIVDTAEEGIWVATPDGKATYVNQKMADMLGYPKEAIMGKVGLEFLDKPQSAGVLKNRKILEDKGRLQTECRFIRKDGSILWTIANTASIFDNQGNHVANIAMHTNITKRKKAEEALRRSEEQAQRRAEEVQTLMDIIPVAIWISNDPECKNIVGNSTANHFYEAIEGENVSAGPASGGEQNTKRRFFRDGKELLSQDLPMQEAARKKVEIKNSELEVVVPSGKKRIILGSAKPLLNSEGKVRGSLGAFVDITERKKTEEALKNSEQAAIKHANELKAVQEKLEAKTAETEKFATEMESLAKERAKQLQNTERLAAIGATAGMVGHDIRNPLQAITSEIYLLNSSLSELPECCQKAEMKESMDGITANVGYINKIVADLQDYARPLKPEYTTFDLTKLIDDTLKTVSLPDNIQLSVAAKLESKIKSDQTYLRRSVTNLVNNAIQAMPNGGTVSLTCQTNRDRVLISITDTGVGIPEHVKPRLFTPMMTTKSKGQGLGLAVVKRLIEALNGSITFESQEGKGTKFTIELPTNMSA